MAMSDQETREQLNRLYWESDASVSEIADRLDISRRALYDGIEPRPAGVPCPECGDPLGFRNRTSAENGEAECGACGHVAELEDPAGVRPPQAEQQLHGAALSPTRRVPTTGSGPLLGLLLLVGLGIGALVAYVLRRG
jgi:endogenous inhibitor of DNA gyrase (YacG/DUF329 family)